MAAKKCIRPTSKLLNLVLGLWKTCHLGGRVGGCSFPLLFIKQLFRTWEGCSSHYAFLLLEINTCVGCHISQQTDDKNKLQPGMEPCLVCVCVTMDYLLLRMQLVLYVRGWSLFQEQKSYNFLKRKQRIMTVFHSFPLKEMLHKLPIWLITTQRNPTPSMLLSAL